MKLTTMFLWHLALCLAVERGNDDRRPQPYDAALDKGSCGYYSVKKFITSKLTAPETNFLQWSPECDNGKYDFITPKAGVSRSQGR